MSCCSSSRSMSGARVWAAPYSRESASTAGRSCADADAVAHIERIMVHSSRRWRIRRVLHEWLVEAWTSAPPPPPDDPRHPGHLVDVDGVRHRPEGAQGAGTSTGSRSSLPPSGTEQPARATRSAAGEAEVEQNDRVPVFQNDELPGVEVHGRKPCTNTPPRRVCTPWQTGARCDAGGLHSIDVRKRKRDRSS